MKPPRRSARASADARLSTTWRNLYATPHGREAISALMVEFDMFNNDPGNDPNAQLRAVGRRDVLLRITQLIGLKPSDFVDVAWDAADDLDNLMRN